MAGIRCSYISREFIVTSVNIYSFISLLFQFVRKDWTIFVFGECWTLKPYLRSIQGETRCWRYSMCNAAIAYASGRGMMIWTWRQRSVWHVALEAIECTFIATASWLLYIEYQIVFNVGSVFTALSPAGTVTIPVTPARWANRVSAVDTVNDNVAKS